MEKGKLLYDESHQKEMKKWKMNNVWKWGGWQFISCMFVAILIIFLYLITKAIWYLLFFLPLIIIVGCPYLIGAIGHYGDLKVYENGIKYPRRSLKEIIYNKHFAPFQDIGKIVIKGNDGYIIHLKREGKILFRGIYKEDIFDKDSFLKAINNKVKFEYSNDKDT